MESSDLSGLLREVRNNHSHLVFGGAPAPPIVAVRHYSELKNLSAEHDCSLLARF
jgi:hypothetical protein